MTLQDQLRQIAAMLSNSRPLYQAADRIDMLHGQNGVLRGLLRECVAVIDAIDTQSVEEFDRLSDLTDKAQAAADGVAL